MVIKKKKKSKPLECLSCERSISRRDDYVQCKAELDHVFHIGCSKMTDREYAKLKESGEIKNWICYSHETQPVGGVKSLHKENVLLKQLMTDQEVMVDELLKDKVTLLNEKIILLEFIKKLANGDEDQLREALLDSSDVLTAIGGNLDAVERQTDIDVFNCTHVHNPWPGQNKKGKKRSSSKQGEKGDNRKTVEIESQFITKERKSTTRRSTTRRSTTRRSTIGGPDVVPSTRGFSVKNFFEEVVGADTAAPYDPPKGHNVLFYLGYLIRWIGSRHIVTFMLFLGMANAYIMRTNMSVAIVAMTNHSAITNEDVIFDDECDVEIEDEREVVDGEYPWPTDIQSYILSSFFYGYVITQIPFGILSKRYGSVKFLGYGMLINSLFGLLVPISARWGLGWLITVRFIQGLGEGPIVPCTHALLAKWIPPNERSRMGAFVYAGAQFGTVISMPLSGLLSASSARWPSVFYVFGAIGTVWSIAFLLLIFEDPQVHPRIKTEEKDYIQKSLWGTANATSPPIPWKAIVTSLPFWAILIAHMGHNYGYETLMTELPTYMHQVLRFSIKGNGLVSALPYLAMWFFSMGISHVADWMLTSGYFTHTSVRKIINGIGQYGPAVALISAAFTGCDKWLTVGILTVGVGLNGGIYSGFKVNHLDISPRFAGILMAFTNCLANLAGLLAPIYAGNIVKDKPTKHSWGIVFITAGCVYAFCCTFYIIFASGQRQPWDNPDNDVKEPVSENGNVPRNAQTAIQVTQT